MWSYGGSILMAFFRTIRSLNKCRGLRPEHQRPGRSAFICCCFWRFIYLFLYELGNLYLNCIYQHQILFPTMNRDIYIYIYIANILKDLCCCIILSLISNLLRRNFVDQFHCYKFYVCIILCCVSFCEVCFSAVVSYLAQLLSPICYLILL